MISLDPNSVTQSMCCVSRLHVNPNFDKYVIYILTKIIDIKQHHDRAKGGILIAHR